MVAAGEDVDPGGEQLLRGLNRQAEAAGSVLAVRNAEIDAVLLARRGEAPLQRVATRRADDVADDEDVEPGCYLRAGAFAFRLVKKYTRTRFSSR